MELKLNGKLFPDHLSFILHGALVGEGSSKCGNLWRRCHPLFDTEN